MTDDYPDLPSLALITQYITALRARDNAAMQDLRSPDFILDWVHNDAAANPPTTHDVADQFWSVWFSAFPEMDYEVTRTIAAEDVVVTQWVFTGTQAGPLGPPIFDPPLEQTGKTIRLRGISVYDIQAGFITKETMYIDLATFWVELGVSP
jgi:steroid delta-isomerase-like uncharacterized protein